MSFAPLREASAPSASEAEKGTLAAEFALDHPESHIHEAPNPLEGYEVIEITIRPESPKSGTASLMCPGRRDPLWSPSPKGARLLLLKATASCAWVSGSSCSPQRHRV